MTTAKTSRSIEGMTPAERKREADKLRQEATELEAKAEAAQEQIKELTKTYNRSVDRAYILRRMAYSLENLANDEAEVDLGQGAKGKAEDTTSGETR